MKPQKKRRTLEEHLIEKIKESGYPLEIEISNLLDEKSYVVFNTQHYFDEESKQGRDIDIYAMPIEFLPLEEKLAPFYLRTEVAIECKKSETHAWVFYTRPHIPMSWIYMDGQCRTSVPKPKMDSTKSFESLLKYECFSLHYDQFERVAIAYDEIKKEKTGSSRREIFEAVNQLVKFTCYEIHQTFSRTSKLPKTSPDREFIMVFFPIIVFDGDMYEVTFDSKEPRPKRKNHILLKTHYRSPYSKEVESFMVDVVHRSYFTEFVEVLRSDFYRIRERILQNHDELVKACRETYKS